MNGFPEPAHALLIGRTEVKRRLRILTGSPLQFGAIIVAGLFLLALAAGGTFGAYLFGQQLAAGTISSIARYATWASAGAFLSVAAITCLRIVGEGGEIDHPAGMLTTVRHEDIVGGILVTELTGVAAYVLLPLFAASTALAVGAKSVFIGVSVFVTAVAVLSFAALTGHALGYVLRYAFVRSAFLAAHKTKLAVAVFLAYLYFVTVQQDPSVFLPILTALGQTPMGWLGLTPLVLQDPTSLTLVLGGWATIIVLGPALLFVATAAAGRAWYADEVSPTTEHDRGRGTTTVSAGVLERYVGRPTAWVARISVTRAYRAPMKLVFVLYPAFFIISPIVQIAQTGVVPPSVPILLAVYGAWAVGAGFALNPLGDEGAMLPVTLTSGITGDRFLLGLVVATTGAGTIVVLPLTLIAGALVPLALTQLVFLAITTVALLIGGAMLATGIGCAFPRFESVRISRSRRVVAPSLIAFAIYSLVLVLVATPGMVTQVPAAAAVLSHALPLSTPVIRALGTLLTATLVALCGLVSYRGGARTIDTYRL